MVVTLIIITKLKNNELTIWNLALLIDFNLLYKWYTYYLGWAIF